MSQSKIFLTGSLSLDSIFSLLPILLMCFYVLNATSFLVDKSIEATKRQIMWDKITAVADYYIKVGLSEKAGDGHWPNLLVSDSPSEDSITKTKNAMVFEKLSIGPSPGEGTCVYRIALVKDGMDTRIEKIYFCGE